MDDEFLTETSVFHQIAINPGTGFHRITIIDQNGYILVKKFEIMN
ncbi:MAG: hypothetical protein HC830_13030 [Bacteroidetes bacterium]|nr:hypothetical protein [Bacteroidota bacterium]